MAWHQANTPKGTFELAPGASEEEIVHLEEALGFRLPEDLRVSFALHNGARVQKYSAHGDLLGYGEFLSTASVLKWLKEHLRWQTEDEWGLGEDYETEYIQGPIKPFWWSPLRLRSLDNSGDGVMADFDPALGGTWGQIIEFDHEVGPRRVLAPSFGAWLTSLADGLEKGEYVYIEGEYTGYVEKF